MLRFWRFHESITYVFSIPLNIPSPPPPYFFTEVEAKRPSISDVAVACYHRARRAHGISAAAPLVRLVPGVLPVFPLPTSKVIS
jgi:hypothetical protein